MTDPKIPAPVAQALRPCPFCGAGHTLKVCTAQEIAEDGDDDPPFWEHEESWAVLCDASRPGGPGGCGASGGFFPSQQQAADAWNRRAEADTYAAAREAAARMEERETHAAERDKLNGERFDLALLIKRLIVRMGAAREGNGIAAGDEALRVQALGYLTRKGLNGIPLRDDQDPVSAG